MPRVAVVDPTQVLRNRVLPEDRQSTCECGETVDIEDIECPFCGLEFAPADEPTPAICVPVSTPAAELEETRISIRAIKAQLNETFVEREPAVDAMTLAYLTGQHYLLVGGPGTGKTALVKRFLMHLTGARQFGVLLGKFTPPEKVFGPMDVKKFQEGIQCTQIKGKAAWAEFVIADEYYKCSEACLNEMLGLMNERVFEDQPVPLMTMATITNWPELEARTEMVDALHDRILLRVSVPGPADEAAEVKMLAQVDAVRDYRPRQTITLEALKAAQVAVSEIAISDDIRLAMVRLRRALAPGFDSAGVRVEGIENSPRRMGQLQDVMRANAWLAGRDHVSIEDFGCLQWGMWDKPADIQVVLAQLKNIDAVAVKQVTDAIDAGQGIIRAYNNGAKGAAQLNKCLRQAAAAAAHARKLLDRPLYTAGSRQLIAKNWAGFKSDYSQIVDQGARAKSTLGQTVVE